MTRRVRRAAPSRPPPTRSRPRDLHHLEVRLGRTAVRAAPVLGDVVPAGARGDAVFGPALGFVVFEAALHADEQLVVVVTHVEVVLSQIALRLRPRRPLLALCRGGRNLNVVERVESRPSRVLRSPGSTSRRARPPTVSRPGSPPGARLWTRRRRSRSRDNGRRSSGGPRVTSEHLVAHPRVDVHPGDVAVVVLEHPVVHHLAPQRREVGQRDHRRVAAGQVRCAIHAAQRLVAPGRIGVVVAVTLQVVQEQVGHDVVGVPAVHRGAPFVAAAVHLLPHQPVVLEIVHRFEQREAEHRGDQDVGDQRPAEHRDQHAVEQHRHRPGIEHVVRRMPLALAGALQPLGFELPG